MWVFGYGSLIWDDWANQFGCTRFEQATLEKYRRDFNKASIERWGSREEPGPTLGLTASETDSCTGRAFEFDDSKGEEIIRYLRKREGPTCDLEEMDVVLPDGHRVPAIVPLNNPEAHTFIGDRSLKERAELARSARGEAGTCADYVRNIWKCLQELGIHDSAVEDFWKLVSAGKR